MAVDSRATAGSYIGTVLLISLSAVDPDCVTLSIWYRQKGHRNQPILVGYHGWRSWFVVNYHLSQSIPF